MKPSPALSNRVTDWTDASSPSPFVGWPTACSTAPMPRRSSAPASSTRSRPYEAGDPVKQIDWRVTARMGRPFIKEYEAPKQMPVYLLVDTSGSMRVQHRHKQVRLGGANRRRPRARGTSADEHPVGMIGCGERAFDAKPLSEAPRFSRLHQLRHYRFDEATSLVEKLDQLTEVLTNRAMLIVLSDLRQPDATERLKRLAQKHDCVVLQLTDPAEHGRLRAGIFRGEEAETGRTFVGHGRSRWFDDDETADELRRGGIDHLTLPINEPFIHALRGFLRKRDCLGRGAR